ncbi:ABC transporter ATP-binding protein [Niallia sp. Krafla_26]|uniref:ABC transporter ATP-binding protein n=1 Tax=Niallia sp. Krafla_26 TaxID=3064703 RepID=UPI003D17CBDA
MSPIIEVAGVSKAFDSQSVLKNVNFNVNQGEIIGLLGPNGVGKTTFIRILNGVLKSDSGSISILGYNPVSEGDEILKVSGIVTESAGLYGQMSGEENLAFFAELYGVTNKQKIDELLKLFDLQGHKHKNVSTYSTGMKKRLALAKALIHEPQILFLDEPTNGLDPDGIKMVLSYLKKYNQENGTTIMICSHVLHQLEDICHSFAFMEKQTIVEQGSLEELESKYIKDINVKVYTDFLPRESSYFLSFPCRQGEENHVIFTLPSKDRIPFLLQELLKKYKVYAVEMMNNDLESIYFKVREKINE